MLLNFEVLSVAVTAVPQSHEGFGQVPRRKGESVMSHDCHLHRRLRGIIGGAALAGALLLANPAGAQAAGTNPAGVWGWIEALLGNRAAALTGTRTPPRHTTRAKDLVCPPAGCPTTPTTNQGPATDPDGRTH